MKFSSFIVADAVRADLQATDKRGVIEEMIAALVAAGAIKAEELPSILQAVMKREDLGSTGIGRSVAVPHAKHDSVNRLVGTVGISSTGVDFNSLDGEKVHIFFLLISPTARPGDHLRALEYIARQLRNETFCRFLKQAKSVDDIKQLLEEADNEQP